MNIFRNDLLKIIIEEILICSEAEFKSYYSCHMLDGMDLKKQLTILINEIMHSLK